ncbi:hypothetical protein K3152_00400 [Qipengyuania sp. 1NDH17]|uniref:Uncharacterized protein n=1 Tax=Qipengyuania polymorpha TaxID=2867234 RepID=A0ABS7ITM5_9SPHN|nr:hypothetical protein [Qipengyuania polymorpha]MBX7456696.1 hypothetical protein [Qipengyuania polymorpha]
MRSSEVLAFMAVLTATPSLAGEPLTKEKLDARDASGLVELLLEPATAREVVDATVQPLWGPPDTWRATFLGRAQPIGTDTCLRKRFWVTLTGTPDGEFIRKDMQETEDLVVLQPGKRATLASCATAEGYVNAAYLANRFYQVATYRMFRRMMSDAAGKGSLSFRLRCSDKGGDACSDPRAALASLPVDKLFSVSVLNVEKRQMEGMSKGVLTHPPIAIGKPYTVEISFGPSGNDSKSWRVYWTMVPDKKPVVELKRQTVYYH